MLVTGSYYYNTDVKISGNNISVRKYSDFQLAGYKKKGLKEKSRVSADRKELSESERKMLKQIEKSVKCNGDILGKKEYTYELKQKRFERSVRRARTSILDLVACNVYKHRSFTGKKETAKFLTLTFKECITDIKKANAELKKFMQKVSYYAFKVKKNVIKYICVPELQKRGAWHFHLILFNCPYIKHSELLKLWGFGGVNIKKIKGTSGQCAKYVVKYLSGEKGDKETKNIADFSLYEKLGLQNMKRYSTSRGLKKTKKYRLKFDNEDSFYSFLEFATIEKNLLSLDENNKKIDYRKYELKSEQVRIGSIEYFNFMLKNTSLKELKKLLDDFQTMQIKENRYSEKIDLKKARKIKRARKIKKRKMTYSDFKKWQNGVIYGLNDVEYLNSLEF